MAINLELLKEFLKYNYQYEYFESLANNFDINDTDKSLELVRLVYNLFVQEFDNFFVFKEFLDSFEFSDFNRKNSTQWSCLCYIYQVKYIVNDDIGLRKEIFSILVKDLKDNKIMEEKRFNRVMNGSEIAYSIEIRNNNKREDLDLYYSDSIELIINMIRKNIYEYKDNENSFSLSIDTINEIKGLQRAIPKLQEL
ncbi:hypothetical protein ACFODO_07745 [Acinetobacter sichuanensis]|uniref:Uncharacterized protein n=1 Tax=Acinetobacter sichuanensis TaxID=2136183 RepID=A0A371YKE5_9GAMM|nr:hypothetical protein [Acinetobacter sichuanensis]RFC81804.1 hypothetical protein C9E89_019870 [Acinetobacter sichuanensis]